MAAFKVNFLLVLFFRVSYQYWVMHTRTYPLGKNRILMYCYHRNEARSSQYLTVEIRPNKQHNWIPVQYVNDSGSYKIKDYDDQELYPFLPITVVQNDGDCKWGLVCVTYLNTMVQLDSCTIDQDLFPTYRCRVFDGNSFDVSPEMNIVESIEGPPPKNMKSISIIHQPISRTNTKATFDVGDVLQLQCIGEVENINATPSLDIRWCKRDKDKFRVIQLQDDPITKILQKSNNGCSIIQESSIFYHITHLDMNLQIMCESGYYKTWDECGVRGINTKLFVPTTTAVTQGVKENQWRMSPILIHNMKSRINPKYVESNAPGTTIHLISTASIISQNTSLVFQTKIIWCFRKHSDDIWTKLTVRNVITEAISNTSGEIRIFNEMKYQLDISHTEMQFMCEISYSSLCGKGLASSNISINSVFTGAATSKGEDEKRMSPIMIYNRKSRLSPYLEIEGAGATLNLLITASIIPQIFPQAKNLNWCIRKQNDKTWRKVTLQENITEAASETSSGETKMFSEIRYHVNMFDTDIHFLCEISNSSTCGSGFASSNISLKIVFVEGVKGNTWTMSPIVLYNQNTSLNPQFYEVKGDGSTIDLLSSASIISQNSSLANVINWCLKRQNNETWTKIPLRGITEVTSNSSGELKIFSEIRYHLTNFDSDIQFLCEISYSSSCGTGIAASTITLHRAVEPDETQRSVAEPSCSLARSSLVIVLPILVLFCMVLCLLIMCRRKEITICGWSLRIERSDERIRKYTHDSVSTSQSESTPHSNMAFNQETIEHKSKQSKMPECNVTKERESLYENNINEHEHERTPKMYEDLKIIPTNKNMMI